MATAPDSISAICKMLKNKRAFLKRNLTILQSHLSDFKQTPEEIDKISQQLLLCEKTINNYNSVLEDYYDEDHAVEYDQYFLDNDCVLLFSKLKVNVASITASTPKHVEGLSSQPSLKLPSVALPTYSGRFDEWISFKNKFYSLIDANSSIPKIQKLQYLMSALTGDAYNVVKFLEITESNYKVALDILLDRFENKRIIIKSHLKALFEFPNLTKDSHCSLRKLLDAFTQHLRALASLGRPVDKWDDIITYLILSKLPNHIRNEWEGRLESKDAPSLEDLKTFLSNKCHALEFSSFKEPGFKGKEAVVKDKKTVVCGAFERDSKNCIYCDKRHSVYQCYKFLKLNNNERVKAVEAKRACLNCLKSGHSITDCKTSRCRRCDGNHHTLLHLEKRTDDVVAEGTTGGATSLVSSHNAPATVLLSTCLVNAFDYWGNKHELRLMLDSGSQINFITSDKVNSLALPYKEVTLPITGINNKNSIAKSCVNVTLQSKQYNFQVNVDFYVLKDITTRLPADNLDASVIHIPKNVSLADPTFFKPRRIDALLGAEIFYKLLSVGQIQTNQPGVILQKSLFGWLVTGKLNTSLREPVKCNVLTLQGLNNSIKKFWELEQNASNVSIMSAEEQNCEAHFKQTFCRNDEGRFVLKLPWKELPTCLGDSYELAKRRFCAIERKLDRDLKLKKDYDAFMLEYLNMNHMKRVTGFEDSTGTGYFLPHHAVLKEDSLTTKLRVVFDASAKTTSGKSLNDLLMIGPKLQNDIFPILLRFRTYQYVITSDIAKMYRQVLINETDTKYQRILWRFNKTDPIDVFELLTVTYGIRPASFLATRCLLEIAKEIQQTEPKVSQIIANDFYMDDLLTGSDSLSELYEIQKRLYELLFSAGFELRKWASNSNEILAELAHTSGDNYVLRFDDDATHLKTLGVYWAPNSDIIQYYTSISTVPGRVTKRSILSNIAQIFDPLGLLGPAIVVAKLLMQNLWKLNITWDESVPMHIHTRWIEFLGDLSNLPTIKINRRVVFHANSTYEIHGFCDASTVAFAACVYVRSISDNGNISCNLMCSKSRVAPLKVVTLPRLELCAAVLLAELVSRVKDSLRMNINNFYYYSDSMIALCWIKSCPTRWGTFVSHRIGNIQERSDPRNWYHVPSAENPADLLSRGVALSKLRDSDLWWTGPHWLRNYDIPLHEPEVQENLPEARALLVVPAEPPKNCWLEKHSNLTRLLRVMAFVMRFIHNCKQPKASLNGPLSVKELHNSELILAKYIQHQHFLKEVKILQQSLELPKNNKYLCLNPFIDDHGILRVGGRLRNSTLRFSTKFPILLPNKSHFTNLLIQRAHLFTLHGGVQTTLAQIRENHWIVNGRNTVKGIIRQCVTCFKANPIHPKPLMGQLPNVRTEITRPFCNAGVDYFGPLFIKEGLRRTARLSKAYGAMFVCMATKAVHIELVSSLSTEAFLATLKRFIARRGCVKNIYSDNATNFKGADKQLTEMYSFFCDDINLRITDHLSKYKIQWHFIPPRAPHFGGLWESAIKSAKRHLNRIIGNAHLNFEEMITVLAQIESVLNSRPLLPLSNDPNDYSFLTPSHFLISDRMDAIPEENVMDVAVNRLSRWKRLQQLNQHFWSRWRAEYLINLQRRNKWSQSVGSQLKIGQLVLIAEDNVPPRHWPIGRVIQTHPGRDDVVRAATVKTPRDTFKRPAQKLCVLPFQDNE
ncbi:hypothetical protein FQR65_LT19138 [Abscondita terminalis]|nr:hypothetical protein FQR65_LT19138 [Abscondita terminalis]